MFSGTEERPPMSTFDSRLFQVRGRIYELLVNCIPPEVILKVIIKCTFQFLFYCILYWRILSINVIVPTKRPIFMRNWTTITTSVLLTYVELLSWSDSGVQKLLDELMKKLDSELKHEVCHWAAFYVSTVQYQKYILHCEVSLLLLCQSLLDVKLVLSYVHLWTLLVPVNASLLLNELGVGLYSYVNRSIACNKARKLFFTWKVRKTSHTLVQATCHFLKTTLWNVTFNVPLSLLAEI